MPAMVTSLASDDGFVTHGHLEHYKRCCGPGLVMVEAAAVSPEGRIGTRQLTIHTDLHTEGFARIARILHAGGAVVGIQLHHAGATAFAAETPKRRRRDMVAIALRWLRLQATVSGLDQIRDAFRTAARRAAEAGADIVEIHAAHGYLFTQLLSPLKNRRMDRYGGCHENRQRFLLEVYRTVSDEIRGKALVTCRLGVTDGSPLGLSLSDGLSTARALEKEGVKVLDVSSGSGNPRNIGPRPSRFSARLHLAREAKGVLRIPVIGGGGIRHPDLAEQALKGGMADLIWVGRGMLADPAWARKTVEGKPESISLCCGCSGCSHFTDASRCPAHIQTEGQVRPHSAKVDRGGSNGLS